MENTNNKRRLSIITLFFVTLVLVMIVTGVSASFIYKKQQEGNEAAAIKLYEELIDKISNNISNYDKYISIQFERVLDPLNKKTLSKNAKNEILNYCKKYKVTVYTKSLEELIASRLGKADTLDGILIKINMVSISYNQARISVSYYKANLSAGGTTYTVKYNNNKWDIYDENTSWIS